MLAWQLPATTRETPHANILNMAATIFHLVFLRFMTGNISSNHPRSGYINDKYCPMYIYPTCLNWYCSQVGMKQINPGYEYPADLASRQFTPYS